MAVIDFRDGPSEAADPPHSHSHQQVSYVAAGELLVHIGDDATRLGPDDIFTVPDCGAEIAGMGRVDILVYNAGIIRRQPALEFTRENWDEVVNLSLRSLFFLAQAARRFVAQKSGGKIVNIARMLSFQGGILVPSCPANKSGVRASG